MTDMMLKMRQQGLEERAKQVRDKDARVLKAPNPQEIHKQETIDKINANKIAFRAEQERLKAEQVLHQQVGLPEMRRKEALQEEIQVNQHQNQVFAGAKASARFRMGQEQERQALAQKEHGFKMNTKEADNRVLEAGNNPTPRKENNLNDDLKRQEDKFKKLMRDPKVPLRVKAQAFKQMAQGIKAKNGDRIKLGAREQIARQKALMQKVAMRDKIRVKAQATAANKNKMTNAAIKRLERCA